jgi:hypothetical protein
MREVDIIITHILKPGGSTPPKARHDPDILPSTTSPLLFFKTCFNIILPPP